MRRGRMTEVFPLDRDKLELEYLPVAVVLLPRVHEVKDAIVRPYALPQLLVHPHPFWKAPAFLVALGSFMKPAVLGEATVSSVIRLVDCLRLRNAGTLRLVMTLVY
jgi:hypothetical protein